MAIVFKIKSIKDSTGGSDGSIKDTTGGSDGTTAAPGGVGAVGAASNVGTIKDTTGGSDGTVTITLVDDRSGKEYTYAQPFYKQLCLNEGDRVRVVFKDLEGPGRQAVVESVQRVTVGRISKINPDGNSGSITEKDTTNEILFFQPNVAGLRIKQGDFVRYDLVLSPKGVPVAVNVVEVDD